MASYSFKGLCMCDVDGAFSIYCKSTLLFLSLNLSWRGYTAVTRNETVNKDNVTDVWKLSHLIMKIGLKDVNKADILDKSEEENEHNHEDSDSREDNHDIQTESIHDAVGCDGKMGETEDDEVVVN